MSRPAGVDHLPGPDTEHPKIRAAVAALAASAAPVLAVGVLAVGGLAQRLAEIDRGAYWPDGRTPESDTDHSVSVALVAAYLADRLCPPGRTPQLDRGRLAGLGLVHDMVEVYAGDTWTLNLSRAGRADKDTREAAAADRLIAEFTGVFPWLVDLLVEYRQQVTLPARFTYAADKIASKVPNMASLRTTLDVTGATPADCRDTWDRQSGRLAALVPEYPALAALNWHLAQQSLNTLNPS